MRVPLLLFALGLLLRLLFWQATADRDQAWSAAFAGDAPVWQSHASELARAAAQGRPPQLEELRLPLRPPGMTWLVATIWDGAPASAWRMRLLFAVLGALVAPLLWLVLRAPFGARRAAIAATSCAVAANLMVLGSGPHSEVPYLLGFLVTMLDQERLRTSPTPLVIGRWSILHALLCLLRSEHVLTFAALLGLVLWTNRGRRGRLLAAAAAATALTLLPWHVIAWRQTDSYNASGRCLPAVGAPLPPEFLPSLPWDEAALAEVRGLPGFQQWPVFRFVDDTMRVRRAARVTREDLGVVEEAYGWWPEPLPHPFLALYGPLNFFLGNAQESAGGFSTSPLLRPPRLLGGPSRYPPGLAGGLPTTLSLSYPPHLHAVVHGYALGWHELTADPLAGLLRIGTKLAHGWQGAASGLGGYAVPLGLSGMRRPVDLVVADHLGAAVWRAALLLATLCGLWALRDNVAARPWLVWLLTKAIVIAAFFGYARQGVLAIPAVALCLATAWERWCQARLSARAWRRLALAAVAGLVLLEVLRAVVGPDSVTLDGERAAAASGSPREHEAHRIEYGPR